ncbi:MAG TPA: RICIN domain-containing protein [Polyangiaceae bacterium]|nr:RICIN domain-containing protein [Polyangiaceae bacterium]
MSSKRTSRMPARPYFMGLVVSLLGCATTPLDVLEAASTNGGDTSNGGANEGGNGGARGGNGGSGGGATCAPAPAALAGTYRLRAATSGKCVGVGMSTLVGSLPARLTVMVNDCSARGEIFQLIADSGFGSFQLRSATTGYNLDIEMLGSSDGTRVILFSMNGLANQRFTFQTRRERVFALIPGNADSSCVTEVTPQPEIFACKNDLQTQEWELVPVNCD